jgi:hypothetical protein
MAIKNLVQVSCSLNLGLIYSFDYSWTPQNGATISIFFVKQEGTYQRPQYMQKAQVKIGNASFSMYVVASDIQLSVGRRVMEVIFMDETFMLDNYQVVPTGKGCGFNVFQLGAPVDDRSLQERQADALDPTTVQIANFTQFPDLEYGFSDFLTILRQKFNVQVDANYDTTITSGQIYGSFRSVLSEWCSLLNLSWFVENSILKIFNPTTLTIDLPTQPTNATSYSSLEDARDTYGQTAYNWYQQEGGQYPLNQTSDSNGTLLVRTNTLYPVGYEYGLSQNLLTPEQVAAAQYGEEFWILYNYYKGSLSQCGWTAQSSANYQSASVIGATLVGYDPTVQQQRFEAFQSYGESVAGRWYLSNQISSIAIDKAFTWFDESNGQITNFTNIDDKSIDVGFLTPSNTSTNIIPGTSINMFYSGVNYIGDRMVYHDDYARALPMSISSSQKAMISSLFSKFVVYGSEAMNYDGLSTGSYLMYNPIAIPATISQLFDQIPTVANSFKPRFTAFPIKGVTQSDYTTLKAKQDEPDGINIVVGGEGGNVLSNTAIIKTLEQGSYTVYYNKYEKCASAYSTGPYFGHRFYSNQISPDNQIDVTFTKTAANTYRINRNYGLINSLVNNPYLQNIAQARSTVTRRVSYTVNYFVDVPVNFLTNGLVGMSVTVGDDGVTATYSFSNEVLQVPTYENEFARYERMIKNSSLRRYTPTTVIT